MCARARGWRAGGGTAAAGGVGAAGPLRLCLHAPGGCRGRRQAQRHSQRNSCLHLVCTACAVPTEGPPGGRQGVLGLLGASSGLMGRIIPQLPGRCTTQGVKPTCTLGRVGRWGGWYSGLCVCSAAQLCGVTARRLTTTWPDPPASPSPLPRPPTPHPAPPPLPGPPSPGCCRQSGRGRRQRAHDRAPEQRHAPPHARPRDGGHEERRGRRVSGAGGLHTPAGHARPSPHHRAACVPCVCSPTGAS